jgi:PEP-CTERM motif
MKLFRTLAVALAAAACGAGAFAQGTVQFQFDPDGAPGGIAAVTADRFDWAPGTAYAVGAIPTAAGDPFTLYYQANLSAVQLGSGNVFSQGAGATFNAVAAFGEITTAVVPIGTGAIATFAFDPANPVNYFRICTGSGNNLSGAGFGCTAANAILTGVVTNIPSSSFNVPTFNGPYSLLDGVGNDDWNGQLTVTGSGTTDIRVNVTSLNTAYFTSFDLLQSLVVSFFNSSQVLPYAQVDPSQSIFTGAGSINTVGTVGGVNGLSGPNMLFQADANQSFTVASKVPEPGSLALIGLVLAGLGAAASRRKA